MFIKVTRSGPRRYVQLVEAVRDDAGAPRQRTVATLGRLDQMGTELESVISGLMRVTGKTTPDSASAHYAQHPTHRRTVLNYPGAHRYSHSTDHQKTHHERPIDPFVVVRLTRTPI